MAEGRRLRVVHVIASSERGGAESALATLLAGLDRERIEPFLAFHGNGPMAGEYRRTARTAVFDLTRPLRPGSLRQLAAWIGGNGAHVVHTHLWTADVIGGLASVLARTPLRVASVWGEYFLGCEQVGLKRFRTAAMARAYRLVYRLFDRIVPVSDAVARGLLRRPGFRVDASRVCVIHPGVDASRMVAAAAGASCGAVADGELAVPLLVAVGNLFPIKGHRWLVDAMPLVLKRCPDALLLLVGDGPERAPLERQVRELGLGAHVRLVGSRADVPQLLAQSRVVVVPSTSEGLGIAILEALALAKPVVASRVGGIVEVLEHRKTGLLVPARDPEALAAGILEILSNPVLAAELGAQGRRFVGERFRADTMVRRVESVYLELARAQGLLA